jgi:hypothetical protein
MGFKGLRKLTQRGPDFFVSRDGLNRLRKNSESDVKWKEGVPQGLKPGFILGHLTYELKPVPFKLTHYSIFVSPSGRYFCLFRG